MNCELPRLCTADGTSKSLDRERTSLSNEINQLGSPVLVCRVPHLFSFIATRSKVFVIEIQPNLDPSVFVERLASLFTDTERTWKGESLMDQKTFKLISGLVLKSSPSPSMSCCSLQLTHTSALAIQLIYFGFTRNHQSLYIETKRELVEKTINTSLGEYPGVIMTIVLRRKINYHLLQVITMLRLAIFILLISIFRPLSLFVLLIFPF